MNRRFFLTAAPVAAALTLTGFAAYVRTRSKEHVVRIPRNAPLGGVITVIKVADDRWVLMGATDGVKLE